jgi:serine phosphatase RsbU (regulator of sigma subunit)
MGLRERNRQFQQFFRSMAPSSRVLMFTTVFATFASLSVAGDTLSPGPGFWSRTIATSMFTGLLGVGYAAAGFGYRWILPFVIVLNIFGPPVLNRVERSVPRPASLSSADIEIIDNRLSGLAAYRITLAIVGYVSFIRVLRREGQRSVAAQTEIRLARDIHSALVPIVSGQDDDLEWYGASRPSGEVGGDLVDVTRGNDTNDGNDTSDGNLSGHRGNGYRGDGSGYREDQSAHAWTGCVADVSGHGVAAGLLMGMFKTALRSAYRTSVDPAANLTQVNTVLAPLKQSHMFVTAAALTWRGGGRFDFVLAGHPSILHVPRGGSARWVGESQLAVGLLDRVTYLSHGFDVRPGDLIAVVTDGLIEIFDRHEQELGADGLKQIIERAAAQASLDAAADAIFDACLQHGPRSDDQSLLLVRVRA